VRVGVIYGGPSVEHDVSIITALQAMEALSVKHSVVPIYISRGGRWLSGDILRDLETYQTGGEPDVPEISRDLGGGVVRSHSGRKRMLGRSREDVEIDVVLPATHGTYGEDGALQGLLELCGVPYVGSPVGASAVAMDKGFTKAVLRRHGLPTLESTEIPRELWDHHGADMVDAALAAYGLPVYVKPVSLGSSIGVRRCTDRSEVADALELAFELDRAALIEPSVEGAIEVNCAVIGARGGNPRASVCEQPVAEHDLLSFDDKYLRGAKGEGMKGAERIIPAPIGQEATERVQSLARQAFAALGCAGVARVDLLIDEAGTIYVNELNTIPGSFSFYLWEPTGLPFPDLLDELLEIALDEHEKARSTTRTFASTLLTSRSAGAKGSG
jgi:D-alanine-D-alanine ligase